MNILLINHYAGSETYGMEYRPYYLAREWVRMGHAVCVVGASFSHLRRVQPQVSGHLSLEVIDGIRYIWIRTPAYQGNGVGRVKNILSFTRMLFGLDEGALGSQPDVIVASSPHPFIIYPAYSLAKKFASKLIFEVRDLWPLTLVELGNVGKFHPFVYLTQHAENYAYRKSDRVISLLPKASGHMISHGMSPEKFAYVPNGVSVENEDDKSELPEIHSSFFESMGNKTLIGYTGTFTESDTLDVLLDASRKLHETVHVVLVGDGPYKDVIKRRISNEKLRNVSVLPPVPKNAVPGVLSRIDIAYIGWRRKPIYRFGVSPNKLFDYMLAEKPVIQAIEAGNDIVSESGCGISIPPENPDELGRAVRWLSGTSLLKRREMGLNGRSYVLAHHDYRELAARFLETLT